MDTLSSSTELRLNRIAELERTISPIQMNLDNLNENIKRHIELANEKLTDYIKNHNTLPIDSNTTLKFDFQDRYSQLVVTNSESHGSWRHGFDLTIELHGFDTFMLIDSRRNNEEGFNPESIQYSINASSCNPNLENIQSLDTQIIKAFLCVEMKTFGEFKSNSFFALLTNTYETYFKLLNERYEIQSEIYPFSNEINDIEREIANEEKAVQDGLTLVEIANHIGERLEFDTEKVEALEHAKYRYGSNLRQMFGLDWYASYIKIVKVSAKTVSITVGEYENKRVKKEDMIKYFPMLKVLVREEGEQDKYVR